MVTTCLVEGLRCFFVDPRNGLFATQTVYQGASDAGKFEFFSRAALEFLLRSGRQPDILHCHDWSTATVAKSYWTEYHSYGLYKPSVVRVLLGRTAVGRGVAACRAAAEGWLHHGRGPLRSAGQAGLRTL